MVTLEEYLKLVSKKKPLETINSETCYFKIQVMGLDYISERLERCLRCSGSFYETCENYKPVSKTNLRFKHLRLYQR